MARFSLQPNTQTFDTLPCGNPSLSPSYYLELFLAQGGGGGGKEEEEAGTQQMFIRVQPLSYTLVYTIFYEKGSLSVYLLLTNSTPFTYLV